MPTKDEILKEITELKAEHVVRRKYLTSLSEITKRDTILYASSYVSFGYQHAEYTSIIDQDLHNFMSAVHDLKGEELDLILHSPGGSLEAAQKIVSYLRSKYKHIRAIIPMSAMSAATMICCACDEIIMAKHSFIGPIDPQIRVTMNGMIQYQPINSIIEEFSYLQKLFDDGIKKNPIYAQYITLLQNHLNKYPPINQLTDIRNRACEIVSDWLSTYMLKGDKDKSKEIADWLGDLNKQHKSHANPISHKEAKERGLNISLLEDNQKLQEKVLSVFHATMSTFERMPECVKIVENQNGKGGISAIQIVKK
jgi:hypothetical protein